MKALNSLWLTEKHIDFEYKQYVLLSYLQNVEKKFTANKLYPVLDDLLALYKELKDIKSIKANIQNQFPKRLLHVDSHNLILQYKRLFEDGNILKEMDRIINFSLPKFAEYISYGEEIRALLESKIDLSPIGILPLYKDEGYLFLQDDAIKKTKVYEYSITIFENSSVKYKGIRTNYVAWYPLSIS
ncbi:MAG: hypothetical protein HRT72_01295, partial [Flavobacteriales bacterium]|nr:hypothetical protein [Flavobacteriales bacterium]